MNPSQNSALVAYADPQSQSTTPHFFGGEPLPLNSSLPEKVRHPGGARSLDFHVPVKVGDPGPNVFKTIRDARSWEWQFRIIDELETDPENWTYHTLTFRTRPTEEEAHEKISKWLKKLRRFWQHNGPAVQRLAANAAASDDILGAAYAEDIARVQAKRLRYVASLERGTRSTCRLHYHLLISSPLPLKYRDWNDPLLCWEHGHHHHRRLRTEEPGKIATYVGKYITKENRRTLCSSKFGWTRTTTLLMNASFQVLALAEPATALKLLRRLCLTPNYPTSARLNYWISSRTSWTVSDLGRNLSQRRIGESPFDKGNYERGPGIPSPLSFGTRRRLVTDVIQALRAAGSGPLSAEVARYYPGSQCFPFRGIKPVPGRYVPLVARVRTAGWFRKAQHPRVARRRARLNSIRIHKPTRGAQCPTKNQNIRTENFGRSFSTASGQPSPSTGT